MANNIRSTSYDGVVTHKKIGEGITLIAPLDVLDEVPDYIPQSKNALQNSVNAQAEQIAALQAQIKELLDANKKPAANAGEKK